MKTASKRSISGMMTLTLLMQISPNTFADTVVTSSVPMVQMPGNYNQMNSTEILKNAGELTQNDRKFIEDTVMKINTELRVLINDHVRNGLSELSDRSNTPGSNKPEISEYLKLRRDYQASAETLKVLINSVTSIPEVGAQNQRTITIQGDKILIDGAIKADFTKPKKDALAELEKIDSQVEGLSFILNSPNSGVTTQKGVKNLSDQLKNPFSVEQLNTMRAASAELRITPANIARQIDTTINSYTTESMQSVIDIYGGKSVLRLSASETDQQKQQALKDLEKLLFARSLFRIMYGIKTGTPNFVYQIKKLNWDFFTSSNNDRLLTGSTKNQNQQRDVLYSMTEYHRTQKMRSQDVFGGDASLLARVSSAWNFIKGERELSKLNTVIFEMLMADVQEDLKLGEVGGLRELKALFISRYYSTQENENYFKKLKNEIIALVEPSLSKSEDDGFGDTGSADNGAVGVLKMAGVSFQTLRSRIEQADQMEATVATYEASSVQKQRTQRRMDGI